MLSTFILLIAGCGHDAYDCREVHRMEVEAASWEVCDARLAEEMANSRIEYPVLEGICLPEGKFADAPLWAQEGSRLVSSEKTHLSGQL
ncbi:hypothetical protein [Algicella marina]|uniref:Uncharacterized protein n=1 Tax=Algicella marina TaxID=2683284 RepID=A0A6P1SX15_9RHOB|nr:hypothetical protein [Algicella marina]QHQ33756.1 hypothetical protein GO499_00455 [Algicella marina]